MNQPASKAPPTWLIVFAFICIYLTWGTTYRAMQEGVRTERLPPALFGGVRIALAGLILLGVQWLRSQSIRLVRGEFWGLLVTGCLLFVGGNGLMTLSLRSVNSGESAVLAATTPLWMALFSLPLARGDRLNLLGWAGLILGVVGVGVLLAPRLREPAVFFQNLDPLYCLGSACAWAIGALCVRHLHLQTPRMTSASYQMIFGGICLSLLGWAWGEVDQLPERYSARAIFVFFYLLFVGSLCGFVAFNWLLAHVSAAKVGTYAYVNPLIAVLIGWFWDEPFTGWLAAGFFLVLAAVFLVRRGERPPRPRTAHQGETMELPTPLTVDGIAAAANKG